MWDKYQHLFTITSWFSSGQVKFGVTRPDRLVSVNSLSYSVWEDEGLLCSFVIFAYIPVKFMVHVKFVPDRVTCHKTAFL